jgi:predicted neutral ceramidase superfamily lipid hydrolase
MTTSTAYYAILDEDSSPERPIGVFRRVKGENGQIDEVFSRNLRWEFSPLLYSSEHGDTMYDFVPISEEEADRIVERIRELGGSGA